MQPLKPVRHFILRTILFVCLFFGIIGLFNYTVDPYGVLRSHKGRHRATGMNSHFVKMRHILNNRDKYDSFILGASTAMKLDVRDISDGNYYSLTYSLGVPGEFLQDLKILVKHGVTVKKVIIGLEDLSYREDPAIHLEQYTRYPYQDDPVEDTRYILKNLFLIHDLNLYRAAVLNRQYTKNGFSYSTLFDIENSGLTLAPGLDEYIESDSAAFVNASYFNEPREFNRPARIMETIADIKEICSFCRSHSIDAVFYISPIHITTYMSLEHKDFFRFRRGLAQVTDFWDFSGIGPITTNNYYFYETSHFRFFVGGWMLNRMLNTGSAPEGFGVYVTRDNIDRHIAELNKQLDMYSRTNKND